MGVVFETFACDVAAAVFVILISLAWYYVRRVYGHWQRKGLAFIPPTFPFGNFKEASLQTKFIGELIQEIYHSIDTPTVGIWLALRPTLLVRDPEIIQHIFIKDFNSFQSRGIYYDEKRDPLSAHLLALPGEKWRHLRGKLSPTFTSGKLKGMFSTLVDCGAPLDAFVNKVASRQGSVEVRELLAQFTTNVIASVAFGIENDAIDHPDNSFRKFGRKAFDPSIKNGIRNAISILMPGLMKWTGLKVVDEDVEEFMLSMVKTNMEYREQNNVSRKDFLQLLLQLRNTGSIQNDDDFATTLNNVTKSMSIPECAAQSFLFFLAGFETSSTTMAFTLYELAKNSDCMRKAQQEIDEIMAKHNGQLTYESIGEMKYLEWCIDESLRIWPSVTFIFRQCTKPWTIPNTNVTIDKGTITINPVLAFHRDPKYWPQPEQFIPERFSPEETAAYVDRPYLPFGAGPRNCIGLRLGKMQTKVGLVFMLQKYNYELYGSSKLPLKLAPGAILLTPIDGIHLKITHRIIDQTK